MKSYGLLPDVELFSSDLTHIAMSPSFDPMKNPFENGLMLTTYEMLSSELKAFSNSFLS